MRRGLEGAGQIEVIAGGMFSGKSEELVRRVRRALIARQRVQVFKPRLDTRHEADLVVTRDRRELAALSVVDSTDLRAACGRVVSCSSLPPPVRPSASGIYGNSPIWPESTEEGPSS